MELRLLRFNAMARPSSRDLNADLHDAAVFIARALHDAGHQAWIVGGAVRDLVLGKTPHEVDLATEALPNRVESLFEHTTAVGKAFGTIVVHLKLAHDVKVDVEVTTFRADGHYADGRRPDEVTYGSSAEEDARRRDFTCNALYLDPLTDDFLDPERGLEDLRAGRLRCVGEPAERFREDGLRLLRMARFAARLGLAPTAEVLAAARDTRSSLRSVSAERVLHEFLGMFHSDRPASAFRLLAENGLLRVALPGGSEGPAEATALTSSRLEVFEALGGHLAPALGLAVLLDPSPLESDPTRREHAATQLERLRPSRALRNQVCATWRLMDDLHAACASAKARSARVRMMRDPAWETAFVALTAWIRALGESGGDQLQALTAERDGLGPADLSPPPLLTSADLAAAEVPRGPLWGSLLERAEDLQLDFELQDRAAALTWLAGRARELAD